MMHRTRIRIAAAAALASGPAVADAWPGPSVLRAMHAAEGRQNDRSIAQGDPAVALARAPGYNPLARGELFAAIWEDGAIVFSADGSGKPGSLRVARAGLQRLRDVRALEAWANLCDEPPLVAFPPDSGPFVLRMTCERGTLLHRWWRDEYLNQHGHAGAWVLALKSELLRTPEGWAQPLAQHPDLERRVLEMFHEPGRLLHR